MLTSHFTFQGDKHNLILFVPVVENHLGVGDEAFIPDYPKNILLSKDLELVPWMVGLTSTEGAYFSSVVPDLFQAGKIELVHQKSLIKL
jgi:hypothetical protein